MIPEDRIADIRERTDIVALVQQYVPLRRSGASFKGVCPFHAEKTPSFYVHPARQFFHCFGCKTSGDSIAFLMKIEGRDFPDVARDLAERAGIELPEVDSREQAAERQARARREGFAALIEAAAGYYMKQLEQHPLARMAREELDRRGIGSDTAKRFRLGYAPHGWDGLCRWLADKDYASADAEHVGLVVPRKGGSGYYDRFRHRLMFPISDNRGRIVAFSGRQLDPPSDEPLADRGEGAAKYVNSPEGPLYKKGEILYGLQEGRVPIRREGWALLCEGNFDLLALHQAGFDNAVAPLGTALTEGHGRLLRRAADRVVFMFDGDSAGQEAVRAAAPMLQRAALPARVVTLPAGQDPDSFLREKGAAALRALVDGAPGLIEHLIDSAARGSSHDASAKAEAIAALGPLLVGVKNPVEVRLYIERVAQKFGVSDLGAVRQQLRRGVRDTRGARRGRPRSRQERAHVEGPKPVNQPKLPGLELELFGVLLDSPRLFATEEARMLEGLLTSGDVRAMFQTAARMAQARGAIDASTLLGEAPSDHCRLWLEDRLAVQKYKVDKTEQALRDGIPRLELQNIERQLPVLMEQIQAARREGDEQRAQDLTRQHVELFQSAHKMKQSTQR